MNITEKLLTVNQFSRPGIKRNQTTKIAVHYVGNPGTSAVANRNYFESCKSTGVYVSSNYIVGLEGEIIRCVPDDEIAYCTNQANSYSVSVETCHPDSTGKFNPKTYASLVELCAMLLKKYNLTANDLIRHFDVTGKVCPKCFVPASSGGTDTNSAAAWNKFKSDVKAKLNSVATIRLKDLYRVRTAWRDQRSQIGAFTSLDNAKKACKPGYNVYNSKGKVVFSNPIPHLVKGSELVLSNVALYVSSTASVATKKISGTYYVYDGAILKGRIKITTNPDFCGKLPIGHYVTGWVKITEVR